MFLATLHLATPPRDHMTPSQKWLMAQISSAAVQLAQPINTDADFLVVHVTRAGGEAHFKVGLWLRASFALAPADQ